MSQIISSFRPLANPLARTEIGAWRCPKCAMEKGLSASRHCPLILSKYQVGLAGNGPVWRGFLSGPSSVWWATERSISGDIPSTGAKAQVDFIRFSARLKPCPFTKHGRFDIQQPLPEARVDFAGLMLGLKPAPFKATPILSCDCPAVTRFH